MAFLYKLEQEDGTPADPPTLRTAVSAWKRGDTIPLRRNRAVRVIDVRAGKQPAEDEVLVVELATAETTRLKS